MSKTDLDLSLPSHYESSLYDDDSLSEEYDRFRRCRDRSRSPRRRRNRSRSPRKESSCDCHPRRGCDGIRCVERQEEKEDRMVVHMTPFSVGFNPEMMKSTDEEEEEVVKTVETPLVETLPKTSTLSPGKNIPVPKSPPRIDRCACEGPGPCGGNRFSGGTWGHSTGGHFKCPAMMREYIQNL